jgi:hypothetical protein
MNALFVTIQTVDVSNAMCYPALFVALAYKTGKWRDSWLYGELLAHVFTQAHRQILFIYIYGQRERVK